MARKSSQSRNRAHRRVTNSPILHGAAIATLSKNDPFMDGPALVEQYGPHFPSARTLERWRMKGQGPKFVKVGRRALYRQSAVERWLDERTRAFTTEAPKSR